VKVQRIGDKAVRISTIAVREKGTSTVTETATVKTCVYLLKVKTLSDAMHLEQHLTSNGAQAVQVSAVNP
jgi:hypothetical protein